MATPYQTESSTTDRRRHLASGPLDKRQGTASRAVIGAVFVLCLGGLLLLVFLMICAAPLADDYCRGILGWRDALTFANYQYVKWTGRWASMALECFVFSAFNLYRSVPIILVALFVLRFFAVRQLLRVTMGLNSMRAFFWTVLLLAVWISISPGVAEGELWATGALEYQLPVTLGLFATALILQSRWMWALPFLMIAATMNELVAVALTGVCANLLWMQRRDKRAARALIFLTVATAMLTAVVLCAPGNSRRAKIEHYETHNVAAIKSTAHTEAVAVVKWTGAYETMGLLLLLAYAPTPPRRRLPIIDVVGWPLLVGALLASGVLIPYGSIPGRVWDILCFVFLLFLFCTLLWFKPSLNLVHNIRPLGAALIVLGLFTSQNVRGIVHSAKQAPGWKRALAERERTHQFNQIQWPPAYSSVDITSDPHYWVNKCEASYLHLASISCGASAAPGQ